MTNNKISREDFFEIDEDEDSLVIMVYEPCTIIFNKECKKENGKIKYD